MFFFYKIREQEGGSGRVSGGRRWYQLEDGGGGERCRRVNVLQILCTHVCKWKSENCWNYSWFGGGRNKMMGWIQVWYIWYIHNNFYKWHNVPWAQQNKKEEKISVRNWGITDLSEFSLSFHFVFKANSLRDPILKKPFTKKKKKKNWWSGSRCRPWIQTPV
jgi:hypothetical protein